MTKKDYRAAMDALAFRADFQARTITKLSAAAQQNRKELSNMNTKKMIRVVPLAAVLAVVLAISAAAVLLLRPSDVARELKDPALAAAFESDNAVALDATVESEGYSITLAGVVSGRNLSDSDFYEDAEAARTYAVVSVRHTDGTPMEDVNTELVMTPLISGYAPSAVNAWTLGGGFQAFNKEGVAYYLFDYQSLEMFADRTVYLAVYQGFAPSAAEFDMADDGAISFTDSVSGPHALFTLPMDETRADPAAVERFFTENGIDTLLSAASSASQPVYTPPMDETRITTAEEPPKESGAN